MGLRWGEGKSLPSPSRRLKSGPLQSGSCPAAEQTGIFGGARLSFSRAPPFRRVAPLQKAQLVKLRRAVDIKLGRRARAAAGATPFSTGGLCLLSAEGLAHCAAALAVLAGLRRTEDLAVGGQPGAVRATALSVLVCSCSHVLKVSCSHARRWGISTPCGTTISSRQASR